MVAEWEAAMGRPKYFLPDNTHHGKVVAIYCTTLRATGRIPDVDPIRSFLVYNSGKEQ